MKLIESKTYKNLAKSYAGECQAHVRYKFIEYGARKQGYKCMAELIDNLVYNEFHHARMFYTYLQKASNETITNIDIASGYPFKEKWDLEENLLLASQDEEYEETIIYPKYRDIAKEEGFLDIAKLYDDIIQVESCHKKLLLDLYNQMHTKTLYKKDKKTKWKCSECGYEKEGLTPWDTCPICEAKQGSVMLKVQN